jgi:hypothetical protein
MKQLPFFAYKGEEPYIFISYSHRDSDVVFSIIEKFNEMGYNIWYDEGIDPGNEWPEEIAKALAACALFIVFISPRSINSVYVNKEISFAMGRELPVLAIHLEETTLTLSLELLIGSNQAIMKYDMPEEQFYAKCYDAFDKFGIAHKPPPPPQQPDSQSKKKLFPYTRFVRRKAASVIANDISPVITSSAPESPTQPKTITIGGKTVDVDVTKLELDNKGITDISALSGLTNLMSLFLFNNNISDISALSGLTNLGWLYLYGNNISDIRALRGLANLEWLLMSHNDISDIRALSGLTKIKWLNLGDNNISDISALSGLANLERLYLYTNNISDITALSGLTNLKILDLSGNPLTQTQIDELQEALPNISIKF